MMTGQPVPNLSTMQVSIFDNQDFLNMTMSNRQENWVCRSAREDQTSSQLNADIWHVFWGKACVLLISSCMTLHCIA